MLKSETSESNQQFINAWSYFASACPKGEVLKANKLAVTWSGTGNVFVNAVFLAEPIFDEAELEAKAKAACDYAKERNQPWWMVVAEDWVPEFHNLTAAVDLESELNSLHLLRNVAKHLNSAT